MSGRKQKEKRRGSTRLPTRIELLEQRQLLALLSEPPRNIYEEILWCGQTEQEAKRLSANEQSK